MELKRNSAIDGLRGLCILLVLLGHTFGTPGFLSFEVYLHLGQVAKLGVRIFFVLSGFLITTLLMKEDSKKGDVSLPKFYTRRFLRLMPALYVYVLVVVLIAKSTAQWPFVAGDITSSLFYWANYHEASWWFAHFWSLSVEEQFYFLWPAIYLLFRRRGLTVVVALGLLVAPLIRLMEAHLLARGWPPIQGLEIGRTYETCYDAPLFGCLAALLAPVDFSPRRWLSGQRFAVPALLLLAFLLTRFDLKIVPDAFQVSLLNLVLAFCVDLIYRGQAGVAEGFFTLPIMVWFGRLSYSLYIWQQPFLFKLGQCWYNVFPINVVAALAAACLSYYLVERPFLALKEKFSR